MHIRERNRQAEKNPAHFWKWREKEKLKKNKGKLRKMKRYCNGSNHVKFSRHCANYNTLHKFKIILERLSLLSKGFID